MKTSAGMVSVQEYLVLSKVEPVYNGHPWLGPEGSTCSCTRGDGCFKEV